MIAVFVQQLNIEAKFTALIEKTILIHASDMSIFNSTILLLVPRSNSTAVMTRFNPWTTFNITFGLNDYKGKMKFITLQGRYNERHGVLNHRRLDCLLKHLFRWWSKKTSKLRVTGLCEGIHWWPVNSHHKGPVTQKMFPFDDVIMKRFINIQHSISYWDGVQS